MARFKPIDDLDVGSMAAEAMNPAVSLPERVRKIAAVTFHPEGEGTMHDVFQQTLLEAAAALDSKAMRRESYARKS